jgi:CheY-like chemotaxis protein
MSPWPKRLWQMSCRQGAMWSISIRPTMRAKRSINWPRTPTIFLLLDINMLDLSGTEPVDQFRERNLPLPSIVFVTTHVETRGRSLRETHRRLRAKAFLERKYQRSLGARLTESKGPASRKIDRSFAAVAEAVFSRSPDDSNQSYKEGFSSSILEMWSQFKPRAIMCHWSGNRTPICCASLSLFTILSTFEFNNIGT